MSWQQPWLGGSPLPFVNEVAEQKVGRQLPSGNSRAAGETPGFLLLFCNHYVWILI